MARLLRLVKYAIYPFLGLSVLFASGLMFTAAFTASFTIENRTDAVLVATPVGAAGPEGDRLPLPVVLSEWLPLPAFRAGDYRLLPKKSVTIYYDMDDINLSEILVETERGRALELVTDPKPTANQYHGPLQSRYIIDDLSQLEPASLPIQVAAHAAGSQWAVAGVMYSLLLGPWLVYGTVSWLSSRVRAAG